MPLAAPGHPSPVRVPVLTPTPRSPFAWAFALVAALVLLATTGRAQAPPAPGPPPGVLPPRAGYLRIVQGVKLAGDSALAAVAQSSDRLEAADDADVATQLAAQAAWLRNTSVRVRRYDAAFGRFVAGVGGPELVPVARMRGALRAAAERLTLIAGLAQRVAALTPAASPDGEAAEVPPTTQAQLEKLQAALTREHEQLGQATQAYTQARAALRRTLLLRGVLLPALAISEVEVPDTDDSTTAGADSAAAAELPVELPPEALRARRRPVPPAEPRPQEGLPVELPREIPPAGR